MDYYSVKTKFVRVYFPSYAFCRSATIVFCILSMAWHNPLRLFRVGVAYQLAQLRRDDLPPQPVFVLAPAEQGLFASASVVGALFCDPLDSRLLSRLRRPVGRFNTELLGVLRVQPLPAAELHRLATNDAADGSSAEKVIQNIETNVPTGCTH